MLAAAHGVLYVHEPFSVSDPPSRGVCNVVFERWFTYVTRANEAPYYRAFTFRAISGLIASSQIAYRITGISSSR